MAANRRKFWRKVLYGLLFLLYLGFLFYVLFFADGFGRTADSNRYRYNLTLFHEIKRFYLIRHTAPFAYVTNVYGNILAFMPFGFLLPRLFDRCRNVFTTVGYSFLFSLAVEIVQFIFKVGCFDVDDLLLNTVGGLLGFLLSVDLLYLASKRRRHVS